MDRKARLLWMKDILEHLGDCFEQWQVADSRSQRFLTESMRRDLEEFRRLCDTVRAESPAEVPLRSHAAA